MIDAMIAMPMIERIPILDGIAFICMMEGNYSCLIKVSVWVHEYY